MEKHHYTTEAWKNGAHTAIGLLETANNLTVQQRAEDTIRDIPEVYQLAHRYATTDMTTSEAVEEFAGILGQDPSNETALALTDSLTNLKTTTDTWQSGDPEQLAFEIGRSTFKIASLAASAYSATSSGAGVTGSVDDVAGLGDDVAGLADDVAGLGDDAAGLADDVAGLSDDAAALTDDVAGLSDDVARAGQAGSAQPGATLDGTDAFSPATRPRPEPITRTRIGRNDTIAQRTWTPPAEPVSSEQIFRTVNPSRARYAQVDPGGDMGARAAQWRGALDPNARTMSVHVGDDAALNSLLDDGWKITGAGTSEQTRVIYLTR